MNKKGILIAVVLVLLPYFSLLSLVVIFYSTKLQFCRFIMEEVFDGNGLYLVAAMVVYAVFTTILCVAFSLVSICKKYDALQLVRLALIVKILQIPAHLTVFVLGVLLLITIFTFPFAIGLFFMSGLSLFLTGILVTASLFNSVKQGFLKSNQVILIGALQFVFFADVITAFIYYKKLKKLRKNC